jgi:hypothetical protein
MGCISFLEDFIPPALQDFVQGLNRGKIYEFIFFLKISGQGSIILEEEGLRLYFPLAEIYNLNPSGREGGRKY